MTEDAAGKPNFLQRNRASLRLAIQMIAACLITYVAGIALSLEQTQWAVLTAIIVMQANVGASIKAMIDRFVGSLGGAVAGVAVSIVLHRLGFSSPGLTLVVGLPPLIVLAALRPVYRVTPITFIILILTPNLQELGPIHSAWERMLEIIVGSVVALAVSLIVLPSRAHDTLSQSVSQALAAMADLMAALPQRMREGHDPSAFEGTHRRVSAAIAKAELAAEEALRERATHVTGGVDPLPVCRTLRRLRHDIAILGRTMATSLPAPVHPRMFGPIEQVCAAVSAFFSATSAAFAKRLSPPDLDSVDASFTVQAEALTQIRRQGLARSLSDDDLTRLFGLGFVLEQMHRNLQDLVARGQELARTTAPAAPAHGAGT